jgi:phage terminase small subunit
MPDKKGRLTPQEAAFAKHMAESGDVVHAASRAGYAHPRKAGYATAARPEIAQIVRETALQRLRTEGLEVGVRVLIELATDERTPATTRRAASSDLVRFAGGSADTDGKPRDPSEMTAAEIQERLARARATAAALEVAAADKARPVIEARPMAQGEAASSPAVDEPGADVFE